MRAVFGHISSVAEVAVGTQCRHPGLLFHQLLSQHKLSKTSFHHFRGIAVALKAAIDILRLLLGGSPVV
jgi:hypothetical protein